MAALAVINRPDMYYHHSVDQNPDSGRLHCHAQYELYYFISGEGEYYIEGSRIMLEPHTLVLLRPAAFHFFHLTGNSPYERCALHFNGEGLPEDDWQLFTDLTSQKSIQADHLTVIPLGDWPDMQQLFSKMNQIYQLPTDELRMISRSILLEMLARLVSYFRRWQQDPLPPQPVKRTLTSEVTDYLNAHLPESVSLDELAAKFFVSKYHLCRTFKRSTGATVLEYLTQKRVLLARSLLEQGLLPKHAAIQCGFTDYSSFYRAFKKYVGLSPRQYEQKLISHEMEPFRH